MKNVPIDILKPLKMISVEERRRHFDWRKTKGEATDDDVSLHPFTAVLRDPTRGYMELACERDRIIHKFVD